MEGYNIRKLLHYLPRTRRMAVSIMNTKQTVPCIKCVSLPGNEKSTYTRIDRYMHYRLTIYLVLAVIRDTERRNL
jgi:hypothetical protein